LLEQLGATVDLHGTKFGRLKNEGGQTDYRKRTIRLNVPNALDALVTLAHEGGHWLSYLLFAEEDFDRETRELLAFNLGWYILESIGATEKLVTAADWLAEHEDLFDGTCASEYADWTKQREWTSV
jgi:hypothetical protein